MPSWTIIGFCRPPVCAVHDDPSRASPCFRVLDPGYFASLGVGVVRKVPANGALSIVGDSDTDGIAAILGQIEISTT